MRLKVGPATWSGAPPQSGQRAGQGRTGRRLGECSLGFAEETQFPVGIDVQPPSAALPGDKVVVAVRACGGGNGVGQGQVRVIGWPPSKHDARVDAPTPEYLACDSVVRQEPLALSEGKLIATTQVKYVPNIKICQSVVIVNSEPRNIGSTIAGIASAIQQDRPRRYASWE